ncbi:MAG: asparagine synthase (glutamine-hydrolyzing) [Myxococcota bacterium]
MCGVVGLWDRMSEARSLRSRCVAMRDALIHRGPDASGLWLDEDRGIALGHRRLSIFDLSEAGAQPMSSPSMRWQVAFNGEIYNFEALRKELPPQSWRGRSDTEVLCAALDVWGVPDTLRRLRGMFALIAWDSQDDCLWLARDRLGQKPLYWRDGSVVLVGSELRALQADPACPTQVDREAVGELIRWGRIRQPRTMLSGVQQVMPGTWVRLTRGGTRRAGSYWSLSDRSPETSPASFGEAVERVEAAVRESAELRSAADVKVGALLSGGVDSSLVTALMRQSGSPVRTYTVAVDQPGYNESVRAAAIAKHLGTEHTELELRTDALLDRVRRLVEVTDEPMGDSSLLPTWLVCQLARSHVTVAVGGDGGDEFFGGYQRYGRAIAIEQMRRRVPSLARRGSRRASASIGRRVEAAAWPYVPGSMTQGLRRINQVSSRDLADVYASVSQTTAYPSLYVLGAGDAMPAPPPQAPSAVRRLMLNDALDYLPNDILVKTDRASMACGLELRAPLLDHKLVELALTLPESWTWGGGIGKVVLKSVLERHVPKHLWDAPKQGFAVPIDVWLRGDLRDWAEDLLSERALQETGLWHVGRVRMRWSRHLKGEDHQTMLWAVLQVQTWCRLWGVS